MAYQMDWIQREAVKHKQLLELRKVIQTELERDFPFSPYAIRSTLTAIRRHYGIDAENETRNLFGLNREMEAAA